MCFTGAVLTILSNTHFKSPQEKKKIATVYSLHWHAGVTMFENQAMLREAVTFSGQDIHNLRKEYIIITAKFKIFAQMSKL
jgi:predicted MPP superfamily phosphohydrolase